jgi:ABC-type dipeptide/oligopeptide/nickel transport system permease subunit
MSLPKPLPLSFQRWNALWDVLVRLVQNRTGLIALVIVTFYVFLGIFAPIVAPYDPAQTDLLARLSPPSATHWFGTDSIGRDILTRTIWGARVSLVVGITTVLLTALAGMLLGMFGGYFRGWFDKLTARLTELLQAFPDLIFAIGMMAFLGPGLGNLIVALFLKGWVEFYRLSRGETLVQATREYVEAARALGHSHLYILFSEILPNIFPSILVLATLRVGYFMVLEASLSFLGVGIPPTIPAWGSMISEGRNVLFLAWWVSTIPGLALLVLVLAINLLGEALREVLDPRLKERL